MLEIDQKTRHKILAWIYLGTPVFILIDLIFDTNIRVAALTEPLHKWSYLGFCFFIGIVGQKNQILEAVLSLIECCLNILLLCLGVFLSITNYLDAALDGANVKFQFGMPELLNLIICGGIFLIAFYNNPLLKMGRGESYDEAFEIDSELESE